MPETSAADGVLSLTLHSNVLPTSLGSKRTVAVNPGQPSDAVTSAIGVSDHVGDARPAGSQLPTRRASWKIFRLSPVRYLNCTGIVAMLAPSDRGAQGDARPARVLVDARLPHSRVISPCHTNPSRSAAVRETRARDQTALAHARRALRGARGGRGDLDRHRPAPARVRSRQSP